MVKLAGSLYKSLNSHKLGTQHRHFNISFEVSALHRPFLFDYTLAFMVQIKHIQQV